MQLAYDDCKNLTHTSKTRHVKRTQMDATVNSWFILGLRKAEQSLKTGLFYYDKISTVCSALKFLRSGGNCSAELNPNLGLSRDGVEVLRGYNSGRWCFSAFPQHFREEAMVCTGIEMIGLVYCGWSYTWTTVVSKITA